MAAEHDFLAGRPIWPLPLDDGEGCRPLHDTVEVSLHHGYVMVRRYHMHESTVVLRIDGHPVDALVWLSDIADRVAAALQAP